MAAAVVVALITGFLVGQSIDLDLFDGGSGEGTTVAGGTGDDGEASTDGAATTSDGTGTGDEGAGEAVGLPSSSSEVGSPDGGTDPAGPNVEVISPTVEVTIADLEVSVLAVVPDRGSAARLEAALDDSFGDAATSDITVDPAVDTAPWLDQLPAVIAELGPLIDGSLTVGADKVVLVGEAPDRRAVDPLVALLAPANGFPPLTEGVVATTLQPALIEASAVDGVLTLGGVVPSSAIGDRLVAAGTELYGEDVADELTVDPATYATFDLIRLPVMLAAFQPGGDHVIALDGGELSAQLHDALDFEEAAVELTPESRQLLTGIVEAIGASAVPIVVTGHTDDIGSDEDNLALSEDRANTVVDHLVSVGIERSRLTAVGKGESEPVTSNRTERGRERNRRVVITIGAPPES